ncbi:polysaccharide deacetylase family protein, partial [Acidobacteria bacterium AH-259-A15]|nr:polysaccharide deacetylase family protein [Acidobacteria bacterium AH-259-A15]
MCVSAYRIGIALVATLVFPLALAIPSVDSPSLPYRFLLVVSDQWKDPASYVIEGGGEFQVVATLLKTWGLPFDILRLDQQRLDRYHLLERTGDPRYGTIIWDAQPGDLEAAGVALVGELVKKHGVNLIVLGDSVATSDISALAGLEYHSEFRLPDGIQVIREHFLSRELAQAEKQLLAAEWAKRGNKVLAREATILVNRGGNPFLTIRQIDGGGRVVWLDAHRSSTQIEQQLIRNLFKRSIIWAQGYALYVEYPRNVILIMHDMGSSENTIVPTWHYRTLTEEEISANLIEPLRRHKAKLVQIVNTGYVDRQTQRVLSPWKQSKVIDHLDGKIIHDYASTKRGLDAGAREGVFEIQSHGWTHMLPDLESPPGPWWTAPMDGVGGLSWYNEFRDRLRGKEIPALTQKFHMQRSIEYIEKDFGSTPLYFRPGGGAFSQSYSNYTPRIAAQMGFGLGRFSSPTYLARDLVIVMAPVIQAVSWAFDKKLTAADVPWTVDGPCFIAFHDRDVAMDPPSVERLLKDLGEGVRYMTAAEYGAYLHARIERETVEDRSLSLAVEYDEHYCRYFATHPSQWTLHLSDQMRSSLEASMPEKQTVKIPEGLGRHFIRIESGQVRVVAVPAS